MTQAQKVFEAMMSHGRAWGQAAQAKIGLHKKKQVTVYLHAKLGKLNS